MVLGVAGSAFCASVARTWQELRRAIRPDLASAVEAFLGEEFVAGATASFVRPAAFPNYTAGLAAASFPSADQPTLELMDAGMDVRFVRETACAGPPGSGA